MLPAVKPRGARGHEQLSGNTLHKMVRSNHDRTTFTCSDLNRSLRDRDTPKSPGASARGISLEDDLRYLRRRLRSL
jgi:hypothetical protein